MYVIQKAFFNIEQPIEYLKTFVISTGMTYTKMAVIAGELLILFIADRIAVNGKDPKQVISGFNPVLKYSLYALFLVLILIFSAKDVSTGFIYAQF